MIVCLFVLLFSPFYCLFFFDLKISYYPFGISNKPQINSIYRFIVDILIANGVDMPEEEFYDLMTKYDLKENGTFSYVEFLRHFILSLKPKEESNLMTRRRLPPTRASVCIE